MHCRSKPEMPSVPVRSGRVAVLLSAALLLVPSWVGAQSDDYLRAIEQETQKLDGDSGGDPATPPTADAQRRTGRGFSPGLSMERFGEELAERYIGSSVFYRKLSRRYREEVYAEYLDGASIDEVRELIMGLYLRR